MRISLDNPAGVAAPFAAAFSNVARVDFADGTLLMLAGQVAIDESGHTVAPGDAAAQTEHIFQAIEGLLAAHGATFANVVQIRAFLTNLEDMGAYRSVRSRYLPTPPPASTTVVISALVVPGTVIEIEVTAAVPAA